MKHVRCCTSSTQKLFDIQVRSNANILCLCRNFFFEKQTSKNCGLCFILKKCPVTMKFILHPKLKETYQWNNIHFHALTDCDQTIVGPWKPTTFNVMMCYLDISDEFKVITSTPINDVLKVISMIERSDTLVYDSVNRQNVNEVREQLCA